MEIFKAGVSKEKLGRRINKLRKSKGISSEQLSEMVGKSSGGYIRMIESAQNGVSLDAFVDICNALDVSPGYLLCDSLIPNNNLSQKLDLLNPTQVSAVRHMIDAMLAEHLSSDES